MFLSARFGFAHKISNISHDTYVANIFISYLAVPRPTLGSYHENNLTSPMLITNIYSISKARQELCKEVVNLNGSF